MYEEAQKIFEYLPIRRDTVEDDYINYLRDSFTLLEKADELWIKDTNGFAINDPSLRMARQFSVMPYHLLFMMSVQYKVLQISSVYKIATNLFFTGVGGRNKDQLLSPQRSVFDIALINERTIFDIFQLVSLSPEVIKTCKGLVDHRNDTFAHAKGGIEQDINTRILEYINVLDVIQKYCFNVNETTINTCLKENKIKISDDVGLFLEKYSFDLRLSPQDFYDIIGILLKTEKFSLKQFEQIINKGFEINYDQTMLEIKKIKKKDIGDKKFNLLTNIIKKNKIGDL